MVNFEVVFFSVLLDCLTRCWGIIELVSPYWFVIKFTGTICVTSWIILNKLFIGQVSLESYSWTSTPNLSSRNKTSSFHDRVRKNLTSSLKSSALLNNNIMANDTVIINNTWMNIAIWSNSHIFTYINWGCDSMIKRMISMNCCIISDRREMSNSYGMKFSSDNCSIPNCGVFWNENISD